MIGIKNLESIKNNLTMKYHNASVPEHGKDKNDFIELKDIYDAYFVYIYCM